MPQIGPLEIVMVLLVALLVFGPKRLPEVGKQAARGLREFKRFQSGVTSDLKGILDTDGTAPASPSADATEAASGAPEVLEDSAAETAPVAETAPAPEAPPDADSPPPDRTP